MNSDRNDWSNESRNERREGSFSYPEEGYDSRYGRSEGEPYRYREAGQPQYYRPDSSRNIFNTDSNMYGGRVGQYSYYGPGYSTANDFSGQEPVRGRLHRSENRREYRGYSDEDYPRYREMYKRSEYPETYRSAMSGYMSEHVGDDSGRRDYNYAPHEGNLYGNRYGLQQRNRPGNEQFGERGYMSEEDYDRGTPRYSESTSYGSSYRTEMRDEGLFKGKGPRNYRRADNRIQDDINDRLTDDPWVDASEVDVKVENCEVTLTGSVDDRQAKRRAEDIVESVSGVMHVENRIKVRSAADNTPPLPVTPL